MLTPYQRALHADLQRDAWVTELGAQLAALTGDDPPAAPPGPRAAAPKAGAVAPSLSAPALSSREGVPA